MLVSGRPHLRWVPLPRPVDFPGPPRRASKAVYPVHLLDSSLRQASRAVGDFLHILLGLGDKRGVVGESWDLGALSWYHRMLKLVEVKLTNALG